ncbi:MAG TPA: SDR family NAD(P)-dependent oxidoreductase, partial [Solirubrobacteraceae bacterium]|nr:SDR family NAD(P)-dependent oxidoreductase [Solirubrobacteraceae bacterium]
MAGETGTDGGGGRGGSQIFAPGLLSGQVALVTGGGTGLGRETALEFARCGAFATIAGRRSEVLDEAVARIEAEVAGVDGAGVVDSVSGDVRERDGADR